MAALNWTVLTGTSTTSGSIANWLNKSTISPSPGGAGTPADFIINEAESFIYRRLRHWQMLTAPTPITLTQGVDTIAISSLTGFLEPMDLWYLNNGAPYWMTQKTPTQVYQAWAYNADNTRIQQPPVIFGFDQTSIQLDSPPDNTYPGFITYYQELAGLSASNDANFLTNTYPRMMRCACMAAACEWAKDNGQGQFDRTYWDQLCEEEIYIAQQESDRARRGIENSGVLIGGGATALPAFQGGW